MILIKKPTICTCVSLFLLATASQAQWNYNGSTITNTNAGDVRLNDNSFLIMRGHAFLYPYEGENSSGTAYIQARQPTPTGTSINLQLRTQSGGQVVEALQIRSDGNVGIGVTNPQVKLHVNGNLAATSGRFSSIYSSNADQQFPPNVLNELGSAQLSIGANWTGGSTDLSLINSNIANTSGGGFSFWQLTSPTSKQLLAYFQGNGNLGIGTATPEARLHIRDGGLRHGGTGEINIDAPGVVGGRFRILDNGNVGIGTTNPGSYRLAVEGTIGAREIIVKTGSWADFVFSKNYKLPTLQALANYISINHHLPGLPSQAEVITNGYSIGEIDAKLLQKIEELTLYILQQQREVNALKDELQKVRKKVLTTE